MKSKTTKGKQPTAPRKRKPTQMEQELHEYMKVVRSNILTRVSDLEDRIDARLDSVQSDVSSMKSKLSTLKAWETLEDAMSKEEQGLEPGKYIKLRPSEVQSGSDRVLWAEGLIRQLPEGHNGRDSWLLNYAGDKHAADVVTAKKLGLAPKEDQNDDWVPKVGQLVFYIPGSGHSENPKEGVVGVITHGPYNYSSPQVDVSFPRVGTWAYRYKFSPQVRPLTPAEIEAHDSKLKAKEDADKLAKLKPGLRVRTEIGDGMYVREDVSCMRPYLVLRDTCVSVTNHQLSDITILD